MPEGFAFPFENVDVWQAIGWKPADRAAISFRRAHWIRAVARLKPGVAETQANAQLQAVVDRLKLQYPATNRYMGAGMTPLHEFLIGDTRLPLLVLLTAVALLLLIACANVGNLLLVQAAGRGREAALRLALGAGRSRLVRQALTESLVLSAVGGCVRSRARLGGDARAARNAAAADAARERLRRRPRRARLRACDHDGERHAVRPRAGALDAPSRSRRRAQGWGACRQPGPPGKALGRRARRSAKSHSRS